MLLATKKIAILIENMYQDMEVWYPYYRLREEGAQVVFVAPVKGKEYHGKYGYPVVSQYAIAEDIKNAGGIYTDCEMAQDRNVITSRKPDDLPAFCKAIIESLS